MIDPAQLSALTAILRHGSFERAAAALHVTPSAISLRIKALEERLGAVLIQRGTPCTATPTGQRLARYAEDVALLEAHVMRDLIPETTTPVTVRIAVNADSLAIWFLEALAAVEGMLFELVLDDQDHSADWLRRGEVSAAVTGDGTALPGINSTPLGRLRYAATASPEFAARWFPDGLTLEALSKAPMMTFNRKDAIQSRWAQQIIGQPISPPTHAIPSTQAFIAAASAGIGWGMNPICLIGDQLSSGALINLAPDHPLDVPHYWQISRLMAPALDNLTRQVTKVARRILLQSIT